MGVLNQPWQNVFLCSDFQPLVLDDEIT